MCVGTGTAIAIGVGAASSLASAKIQSNAAKRAGETQAGSAREALGYEQQRAREQQARLQPYADLGQSAFGRLQQVSGLPVTAGRPPAPAAPTLGSVAVPGALTGGGGPRVGGGLAGVVPPRPPGSLAGAPGGGLSAPGGVLMAAPDGSQQLVPAAQVARAQQLGAQIVRR